MAHRALYFDDEEKGRFVDMLLRTAAFSGIDLLAWCVMTDHFHVLVYVPKARQLADGEVRERIAAFYRDVRRTEKLEELRGGGKRVDLDWEKALEFVENLMAAEGPDAGGAATAAIVFGWAR